MEQPTIQEVEQWKKFARTNGFKIIVYCHNKDEGRDYPVYCKDEKEYNKWYDESWIRNKLDNMVGIIHIDEYTFLEKQILKAKEDVDLTQHAKGTVASNISFGPISMQEDRIKEICWYIWTQFNHFPSKLAFELWWKTFKDGGYIDFPEIKNDITLYEYEQLIKVKP